MGDLNEGAKSTPRKGGQQRGPSPLRMVARAKGVWPLSGMFAWSRHADGIALFLFAAGGCILTGYGQQRALGIVMLLAASIMALVHWGRFWNQVRPVPPELKWHFLWVLWAAGTGLLVAVDYGMLWIGFRVLVQTFAMACAAYVIMSRIRNIDVIFLALMLGGAVQIAAVASGVDLGGAAGAGSSEVVAQVEGLSSNPNSLGFLMVWFILSCLYFRRTGSWLGRLWTPITVVAVLVAGSTLLMTGSRKSLITMVALLYLWVVYALPGGKGLRSALVGAVIGVIVGFVALTLGVELVSDTAVGIRFAQFMDSGGGSVAAAAEENIRYAMYVEGFKMFMNNPIFGVGLNNFGQHFWSGQYSHSNYMEPLATTGLIGFILYMAFYVFVPLRAWRLLRVVQDEDIRYRLKMIMIGMVAIGILGFGSPFYTSIPVYLLLTAFSVATWQVQGGL